MPSWGEILQELQSDAASRNGQIDFDGARRKYLQQLNQLTKRDVVVYASDWLTAGTPDTSIDLSDMQGLMETFYGLSCPNLDLILHSPGGSPEAADRLVRYMRSKFEHVRVFVPLAAMSAATMWALAADEIVMGKHSQLGPIDPQLVMTLPNGQPWQVPARALREQFDEAARDVENNPQRLTTWLPILQQYTPGLLRIAQDAELLGKELVRKWLAEFMFKNHNQPQAVADKIADFFADASIHKSHSRGIDRKQARDVGLVIVDLEADQELQDAVLSVHHAVLHTLAATPCVKLVENHEGRAYVRMVQQLQMAVQAQAPGLMPVSIPATP
jgi:hypothetical protein